MFTRLTLQKWQYTPSVRGGKHWIIFGGSTDAPDVFLKFEEEERRFTYLGWNGRGAVIRNDRTALFGHDYTLRCERLLRNSNTIATENLWRHEVPGESKHNPVEKHTDGRYLIRTWTLPGKSAGHQILRERAVERNIESDEAGRIDRKNRRKIEFGRKGHDSSVHTRATLPPDSRRAPGRRSRCRVVAGYELRWEDPPTCSNSMIQVLSNLFGWPPL